MTREQFTAQTAYEFHDVSIKEGWVLFLVPAFSAPAPKLYEQLKSSIEDTSVDHIVLMGFEYRPFLEVYPEWAENEKVRFSYIHSRDGIYFLSCSAIIYTSSFLPNYFVKKDGQKVIWCGLLPVFKKNDKAYAKNGYKTENCLDEMLEAWPKAWPAHSMSLSRVILYLEPKILGYKDPYSFTESLYEYWKCFSERNQKLQELCCVVPIKIWMAMEEEQYSLPQGVRVVSSYYNIIEELSESDVVITNLTAILKITAKRKIPCIRITRSALAKEIEEEIMAVDWNEVFEKYQEVILGDNPFSNKIEKSQSQELSPADDTDYRKTVLLIVGGDFLLAYMRSIYYWEKWLSDNRVEMSVLFRSSADGKLYQEIWRIPEGIKATVRTGTFQSTTAFRERMGMAPKNGEEELVAKREWERLLGNRTYDEIWALSPNDDFWKMMYRFMPGRKVNVFEDDEMLSQLYPLFAEGMLEEWSHIKEASEARLIREINGKKWMYIGHHNTKDYYVDLKLVSENYVLCMTEKEINNVSQEMVDAAREYETVLWIHLTNNGEGRQYSHLAMREVPVVLLLQSSRVLTDMRDEYTNLLEEFHIPVCYYTNRQKEQYQSFEKDAFKDAILPETTALRAVSGEEEI